MAILVNDEAHLIIDRPAPKHRATRPHAQACRAQTQGWARLWSDQVSRRQTSIDKWMMKKDAGDDGVGLLWRKRRNDGR